MTSPIYPDVPLFPGVPPVLRIEPFVQTVIPKMLGDSPTLQAGATGIWGIYNDKGTLAIEPDNIAAFEFQREYRISDYPIEQGSFESYNKVALPYDARVTMTKGGTISERKAFLDQIDAIVASLDLFTIVTPERIYSNANLTRFDNRRDAENGVSLLTVELHAIEIRSQVSVQFTSSGQQQVGTVTDTSGRTTPAFGTVQRPSGANPVNNGSVQTYTPPRQPAGSPVEAPAFH